MSTRKPHNDLAGYVCELKSHHPKLAGHFVIFDKNKGGDWVTGEDGDRYGLMHLNGENNGGIICFKSLPNARSIMKAMASGSDVGDFGQNEGDLG